MTDKFHAALSFVVLTAAVLAAQDIPRGPIPPGSASIQGRVVDAQSNDPVGGVLVQLGESRSMRTREVKTNADGVFEFAGIADGEYTVRASSPTYVRQCHGALDLFRFQCVPVSVVIDQKRTGIDFRLQRAAIFRGRVIDDAGRPVAGARVWAAGKAMPSEPTVSNKDGSFELTNVVGEEVNVAVEARREPDMPRGPIIYAPGVVDLSEASQLDASPGSLTSGIVIVLPRVAVNTITARVSSSAPMAGVSATLISTAPRMVRRIDFSADGVGAVRGLQDGRYFVSARAQSAVGTLAGFQIVDLAQEVYDLQLPLEPAGRLTGRIITQRGGLAPVDGVRVGASWIYNGVDIDPLVPDQSDVAPDGGFSIDGLFGTRSLQLIGLSPEWRMESVLRGRDDVTSTGVDILPGTTINITIVVARR